MLMNKPYVESLNSLHHIESPVDVEKPVWVYFNLHTGRWSVKQGGLVRCHARLIALTDVQFRVREAGRLRVLREQKKNVHAFVIGKIANVDEFHANDYGKGRSVTYNPYKHNTFVFRGTGEPIKTARLVTMNSSPNPSVNAYLGV